MVTTRTTVMVDKTYEHVVRTLIGIPAKSDTEKALRDYGISSAYDIAAMYEHNIHELAYNEVDEKGMGTGKTTPIPGGYKTGIRHMGNLLQLKQHENDGILTETVILSITKEQYDNYRVRAPSPTNVVPTGLKPTITTGTIELQNFLKGVKRDKSQYTKLKDERQFDNWQCSFLGTARAHHIEEVFDPSYVAYTVEERLLFDEKQKFAFRVLD
jgi:hypothetical protein